jgi:broad specificity phosphatase PhoE
MSRVYMIRHGKPATTRGQSGDPDPGLDRLGLEQARAAAAALMAMSPRPSKVVSSPLRRCRETAQPLADLLGLPVTIDPAVGEVPTPAAVPLGERPAWLREAFAGRWDEMRGDLDYEAWRDSVGAAVASHPGGAVFSHYVAINAAMACVTGAANVLSVRPDHCSITVFQLEAGRLSLVEQGRQAETQVL